jgi:hypothetical protein
LHVDFLVLNVQQESIIWFNLRTIASVSRLSQLRSLCRSLAKRGWSQLFEYHGFDLTSADLARELKKPLKIDRNRPGFEDFCLAGRRAIEPGDPARSLLYHALASPNVHPTPNGRPARDDGPALKQRADTHLRSARVGRSS